MRVQRCMVFVGKNEAVTAAEYDAVPTIGIYR